MKIEIEAPKVMPHNFAWVRNYRSKPHMPWVLIYVQMVTSSWRDNGTLYGHQYYGYRVNSLDKKDYVLGSRNGVKGDGGCIHLTVTDEQIQAIAD